MSGNTVNTQTAKQDNRLSDEQKLIIAKAKIPVNIANAFRILFLIIAILMMIVICIGDVAWKDTSWYAHEAAVMYEVLIWDIVLMLIATFVKIGLVARYNKIVKKL